MNLTNRKGGGLNCIHKSGLNVKKVKTISKKSFDELSDFNRLPLL